MLGFVLLILKGSILTLEVAIFSVVIATSLGLICAFLKLSPFKFLRIITHIYTSVTRGVPELVLMLIVYYGGQILVNNFLELIGFGHLRLELNSLVVGIMTIGFIYGAYMTETFRGAIIAINKGQIEAGISFGFSHWSLFQRIILPQMIHHGIASYTNNWLVILKAVSLVSLIGLSDMVQFANLASGSTKKPFFFYGIVSLIFLLFTSVSLWILKKFQSRYHFE